MKPLRPRLAIVVLKRRARRRISSIRRHIALFILDRHHERSFRPAQARRSVLDDDAATENERIVRRVRQSVRHPFVRASLDEPVPSSRARVQLPSFIRISFHRSCRRPRGEKHQKTAKTNKNHQKPTKTIKKHQKPSKNIKKHQKLSKKIKKHQQT